MRTEGQSEAADCRELYPVICSHLDLFSGIGGFALAARWLGIETKAFCEIDPYARRVLNKNFPKIPIHEDVRKLDGKQYRGIDLITGGYPCQPFSLTGLRKGEADDRHLWPEVRRIVQEARPTWLLCENVTGHITMGLDEVLADLASDGYTTQALAIPACGVGACHRRERVWIIANNRGQRISRDIPTEIPRESRFSRSENGGSSSGFERMPDLPASQLCGSGDGIPARVDRLHALGNAIVPQVAYEIMRAMLLS